MYDDYTAVFADLSLSVSYNSTACRLQCIKYNEYELINVARRTADYVYGRMVLVYVI